MDGGGLASGLNPNARGGGPGMAPLELRKGAGPVGTGPLLRLVPIGTLLVPEAAGGAWSFSAERLLKSRRVGYARQVRFDYKIKTYRENRSYHWTPFWIHIASPVIPPLRTMLVEPPVISWVYITRRGQAS